MDEYPKYLNSSCGQTTCYFARDRSLLWFYLAAKYLQLKKLVVRTGFEPVTNAL